MSCARAPELFLDIFDDAFAAVARVHDLMSVQSEQSELNRLNRARLLSWIEVDPELTNVLGDAQRLAAESAHVFNPCFKSAHLASVAYQVQPGRARRLVDCQIDLSGIAKGYAVDRAVALLEAAGASEILVNAGGDMRHSGVETQQVAVRDAADPTRHQGVTSLRHAALASSVSVGLDGDGLMTDSATVVDGRNGRVIRHAVGASVIASTALLADVIAKVLLIEPLQGAMLCQRHGAHPVRFAARAAA